MKFLYGDKDLLRALDEVDFWKHQESEHATLLLTVIPDLEPPCKIALKNFESLLPETRALANRYIESMVRSKGSISPALEKEIKEFLLYCVKQSEQFIKELKNILNKCPAAHKQDIIPVLIHHMIRESDYFIGIVQIIC